MIKDRLIDDKSSLKDLLALAVCMGVKAGRGDINYSRGPWNIAEDIMNETEETLRHRAQVLDIRSRCLERAGKLNLLEVKE